MCEPGAETLVRVKIPADLSFSGEERWKECGIDACIAPIVKALQEGGIDMRGSCCGHGARNGDIELADGRGLLVLSKEAFQEYLANLKAPGVGQA